MKILFILIFVIIASPIKSKEPIYCVNINSYEPYISNIIIDQNLKNRCPQEISSVEISKKLFDEMKYVQNFYLKKANTFKVNTHFEKKYYADDPEFQKEKKDALKKIYLSSIDEIKEYEKSRETQIKEWQLVEQQEVKRREEEKKLNEQKKEKEKKSKLIELEKQYEKKCQGGLLQKDFDKKSQKFNDCLLDQEAKDLAIKKQQSEKIAQAEEKKQKALEEKNKKIALEENKKQKALEEKNKKIALEENKKQKAIQQKQELDQAKIREEQIKVSNMKPEDRNAYTCSEKFGFRKGSDKFKDCIFELYKAEAELEKLELQKQVAKANAEAARASAEAARASADRQERLALAQTEAAKMQALAARQQAIAANTADSMALIESGLRMMSPQRPAAAPMRTCSFNGRFMNCF